MIEANQLTKEYNGIRVLDIPELKIPKGESFGLVGNNGAGKTTFFRCVLDLVKPNNGLVLSKEEDVSKSDKWKHYTASYLDEDFLIDFLLPEEYFEFIAGINGLTKGDIDDFYARFNDFFNGVSIFFFYPESNKVDACSFR